MKKTPYLLLILIIIADIALVSYNIVFRKQGSFSDEIYSFALANSYYKPFVNAKPGTSILDDKASYAANTENYGEWIPGTVMHDYITVQRGERFSYGSVYYNQSLDHHPPFFYMILHTISSFSPDSFSLWYGYGINIVCIIITQISIYAAAAAVCKNKWAGLSACILYAVCNGSISTFVLIRQYALLTALTAVFLALNACMFSEKSEKNDVPVKKYIPFIGAVSFLIFYTNYPAIELVGAFTACVCLYLLINRKIKQMFIYGLTETAALLLFFAAFPASLSKHIGNYLEFDMPFDFITQFRFMLHYTLVFTIGIVVQYFRSATGKILPVVLVCLILLLLPLCYLFRKEKWFLSLVRKAKDGIKKIPPFLKQANYVPLFCVISGASYLCVLAKTVDVSNTQIETCRYVFLLYPMVMLLFACILHPLLKRIPKISGASPAILAVLALSVGIYTHTVNDVQFLFRCPDYVDPAPLVEGKNCLVVMDGVRKQEHSPDMDTEDLYQTWREACYPFILDKADSIFFTSLYSFDSHFDSMSEKHIDYVLMPFEFYLREGEQPSDERPPTLNDKIVLLNGGCEYEAIGIVNIQSGYNVILKLSE